MNKLTGKQRLQLTRTWLKNGGRSYMDKETYIRRVCEAKGIAYVAPPKIER